MPLGPCTVCEVNPTTQILSRIADGETVNICDDCVVPFALWLVEGKTGIPGESLTAMLAAARDMLDNPPPEGGASVDGEAAPAGTAAKRSRGRSKPTGAASEVAPAADDQSDEGDATATPGE